MIELLFSACLVWRNSSNKRRIGIAAIIIIYLRAALIRVNTIVFFWPSVKAQRWFQKNVLSKIKALCKIFEVRSPLPYEEVVSSNRLKSLKERQILPRKKITWRKLSHNFFWSYGTEWLRKIKKIWRVHIKECFVLFWIVLPAWWMTLQVKKVKVDNHVLARWNWNAIMTIFNVVWVEIWPSRTFQVVSYHSTTVCKLKQND